MKKLLILVSFLPFIIEAQIRTDIDNFNNSHGDVFNVKNNNIKAYAGIDGAPYIESDFQKIKIEGYNGVLPNVRYNAYEDEMEFQMDNKLQYVVKTDGLKIQFPTQNKTYLIANYMVDGTNNYGYLVEVFKKDNVALYKKEQMHIVEYNNNTTNTYLKQKNPYFERIKDQYILFLDNNFYKLPKNSRDLKNISEELGPENFNTIESIIKKDKINLGKESDLIRLADKLADQ